MKELKPVQIIRNYEGVVIMDPNSTEADQKNVFRRTRDIIKSFSGELHNLDTWGRRNLPNPIKKQKSAIYFHTMFKASPQAVAEIERTMRINDKVLRFMHTKLDDRKSLSEHLQQYRDVLADSINRERDREAKFQKKKAMRREAGGGGRPDFKRDDR